MDLEETLRLLQTDQTGIFDLAQVTTLVGFRRGKDGVQRDVTVEILDSGPAAGAARYVVEIAEDHTDDVLDDGLDDDLERTIRAEAASLDAAIATLRWDELDGE